jgi:hypothetical protein
MILPQSLTWLSTLLALLSFFSVATNSHPEQAAQPYDPILVVRHLESQRGPGLTGWRPRATADSDESRATLLGRQVASPPGSQATDGPNDVVVTVVSTSEVAPAMSTSSRSNVPAAPSFDPSGGTSSSTTTSSFGKRSQMTSNMSVSDIYYSLPCQVQSITKS